MTEKEKIKKPNSQIGPPTPNKNNFKKIFVILSILLTIALSVYFSPQLIQMSKNAENFQKSNKNVGPKSSKIMENLDWKKSPISNFEIYDPEDIKIENCGGEFWLVILGHVFNVSSKKDSYSPGSSYHGFIGRDSSRAFVSGDFSEEGLQSDIGGLSSSDYLGLANWLDFYTKTYPFAGYVEGRFFSKNLQSPNADYVNFLNELIKAQEESEKEDDFNQKYPPCNVEWSEKTGTNVWCSNMSGGVKRNWVGHPVRYFPQKSSKIEKNEENGRCVCVQKSGLSDPNIKFYENCPKESERCNNV